MTTSPTYGLRSYTADLTAAGSRTYHPTTERELLRRLRVGMNIYDTVVWDSLSIKLLPFFYYRVTWHSIQSDDEGEKTERLGGGSATKALAKLIKRLALDGEIDYAS